MPKRGQIDQRYVFKRVVDLGKVLRREEASELLWNLGKVEIARRKVLLEDAGIRESALSKCIKKMKDVGLVGSEKSGREGKVRILPLGEGIIKIVNSRKLAEFFSIASDLNRILVLEAIHRNNGNSTCKVIYNNVNTELKKYRRPEMDKDLLRYHLKQLRKEEQVEANDRKYTLTPKGSKTIQTLLKILSAPTITELVNHDSQERRMSQYEQ